MLIYRPTFVSYDITDDRAREHARRYLRTSGGWIQRSLWMSPRSSPAYVESASQQLLELIGPTDRLLVHRPCLGCLSQTVWEPPLHFRMSRRDSSEVV